MTKRRCDCSHWIADHFGTFGCAYLRCDCKALPTAEDVKRECNASCRDSVTARKKCHCICGGSLHGASHSDAALLAIAQAQ